MLNVESDTHGQSFQSKQLAQRLWGDIYFNPEKRRFQKTKSGPENVRSFVQWILEPLYKIFSQVILWFAVTFFHKNKKYVIYVI